MRPRRPFWPPLYRREYVYGCVGVPSYVLAQVALVLGEQGPLGPEADHGAMLLLGFAYLFLIHRAPTRGSRES